MLTSEIDPTGYITRQSTCSGTTVEPERVRVDVDVEEAASLGELLAGGRSRLGERLGERLGVGAGLHL